MSKFAPKNERTKWDMPGLDLWAEAGGSIHCNFLVLKRKTMKVPPCPPFTSAFAALVLCLNLSVAQAQLDPADGLRVVTEVAQESLFKRVPTEKEPAPGWALRMYAGDADFFGIVEAREAFWRHREYEKTIHERNFKHWLMHVEHLVDA